MKIEDKYLARLRAVAEIPSMTGPRDDKDLSRKYIYQVRPSGNLFFPKEAVVEDIVLNYAIKLTRKLQPHLTNKKSVMWLCQVWFPDGGTEVSEPLRGVTLAWHWGEMKLGERGVILCNEELYAPLPISYQ